MQHAVFMQFAEKLLVRDCPRNAGNWNGQYKKPEDSGADRLHIEKDDHRRNGVTVFLSSLWRFLYQRNSGTIYNRVMMAAKKNTSAM